MTIFSKELLAKWAAEALVIALGIFLGITAESWWQERLEQKEETQHLVALKEDFVQSLVLLDGMEARQTQQVLYLKYLLQGRASSADAETVREWLDQGLNMILTYRPQFSAFEDLETSGQMQLLRDRRLRHELAVLKQTFDRLESTAQDFIDSQQNLVDPYLVEELDLAWVFYSADPSIVEDDHEPDFSQLSTREFRSRVAFKLNLRSLVSSEQRAVREQLKHVVGLIEVLLEGAGD